MTSENLKTDRAFEHLGLPPMELAESSVNDRSNTGLYYKFIYSAMQKATKILLLITFAVGMYILLLKLFESNNNTEIILVTRNAEDPNVTLHTLEILLQLENETLDSENNRIKREAALPPSATEEVEDPFLNFSDEDLQKAREIIMKHDKLCNDENQQEICKDLVMELKALNENRRSNKQDRSKTSSNTDNSQNKVMIFADVSKREVLPIANLDSIIETIPSTPLEGGDVSPYVDPTLISHRYNAPSQTIPESCLIDRLLKNSHLRHHEMFEPAHEHPSHSLLPQNRLFAPALHPYHQARETDGHKIHPQDVDIFMILLTEKSEISTERSQNSTIREVDCPTGTRPCLDSDLCIEEKLWCDGNVDCPDVSDESRCSCISRVDKARLCDGYFDCPFGEDEMGCYGCNENTFSCGDLDINSHSTCFTKEQRCNNVVDCPNHKDEVECNMLAPSLLSKPMFAISNTEGFLHRNFKGNWYAVCKNPYMWAHDACRRETGLIIRPPFMQIVPIDPMLKVNYLNAGPGGLLQPSDSCLNSSAVYVTCPDLLCGTKVQSTLQILRENADIENNLFGRNKRFLLANHPYPMIFYGNRMKRNVDDTTIKTDYDIKFGALKGNPFDNMRYKRAESRVVGGRPSQPAAWPWMVAVYRDGMFHCGGVVITHSWVVSAAHCVKKFWDHYYEVQVGMLRRFSFSPQEQSHKVTHIIVNQHYSQKDMKNDLSLLRVERAIPFSRWVRPICLPGPDTAGPDWLWGPPPGTSCIAVGWGATKEHGPDPDHMREVEVPIWEICKHQEDRSGKEICAGRLEGGKDACQGDSGGPLLCRNPLNSQQWYMAGIVSHGDGCGRKGEPGVYTRVSLFVKWIKFHISSKLLPIVQPIQECPGFKCESGISKCLPNKRKCDKVIDCLNGEDEMNCDFTKTGALFMNNLSLPPEEKYSNNVLIARASESFTTSVPSTKEDQEITSHVDIFSTTDHISTKFYESDSLSTENSTLSEISTPTEKTKIMLNPDFVHASTIEIASPTSTEIFGSYSDEHVTADPTKSANDKINTEIRGDAETIALELPGQSLESRSSVSEKLKHEELNNDIDIRDKTTTTVELETSTLFYTNGYDTDEVHETTTLFNFQENNIISDNDENTRLDRSKHNSEELIIELLPDTLNNSNQINIETNHNYQEHEHLNNQVSSSTNHGESSKILTTFEAKGDVLDKIADIISSEFQPAKIRRKHRVPKEFNCRRIFQGIPYHHRCDRKADCEDGTDELDCTCIDYLSTFDQNLICDGMFDCADGQDEIGCYSCPEDRFLCKRSQICLPMKHVCDGKPHCPQGEDEVDCFALTNGKEIEYDVDERPKVSLEGYLTKKHFKDWHVICDDKLSIDQQEQAATHICHYLGFSSANRHYVKYINLNEDEIAKRSLDKTRSKRNTKESEPVHFAYRQTEDNNDTSRHTIIEDPQVIKEQCVPNITKTCKSLYVFCDHSLFTNFEDSQNLFLRDTENVSYHMWPWAAKIYVEGEYRCTGILVNLSWVLISESCLWDSTLTHHFITVALGSHKTIGSITGMYEQVYKVNAKKEIYRSKAILLHLEQPAHYSNLVKPMVISSSFVHLEDKSDCVAIGQDNNNNTISVFLKEANGSCHPSNRCFTRKTKENVCPAGVKTNRYWAGIVSCHTEQGWFPAASFVDSRGECGLTDRINGTDIENIKNEIKYYSGKKKILPSSAEQDFGDNCEGERCGRGRCVPLLEVCDGIRHCEDGNDESELACEKKTSICDEDPYYKGCECSAGQMKCRNGKCVSKELFKDGNNDCGDGTDEPRENTCFDYLARVMPSRLCDGVLHCHDRSDEDPMFCKCFADRTFKCRTKSGGTDHCVAPDMVCDGTRDCPNGEDEATCIGLNAPQGTPYGTGQVIIRSHGVWHSKCYPTQNHTKSELEDICKELGYIGGHAKEIKDMKTFVIHPHNNIVITPFYDVVLNNNTIVKMRNTQEPIARAVFDDKLQNCYPVLIECL